MTDGNIALVLVSIVVLHSLLHYALLMRGNAITHCNKLFIMYVCLYFQFVQLKFKGLNNSLKQST